MGHAASTTTPQLHSDVTCWYTTDTAVWVRHLDAYAAYPLADYHLFSTHD